MISQYDQSILVRQAIFSKPMIINLINDKKKSLKEIHNQINSVSGPHSCRYDRVAKRSSYIEVSTIVNSLLSDADQLEKELQYLLVHLNRVNFYYECLLSSCSEIDCEIVEHYFKKDMRQVDIELNYGITNINRYILQLIDSANINLVNVSN